MKWWMDMANAPNVTLFRPVIEYLRHNHHEVLVTAWDRGQTAQLSSSAWPESTLVGSHGYHVPALAKGLAIMDRAFKLARVAQGQGIDVALGHGSNAQVVAARIVRIPSINMMDYEHHPANHLGFRLANVVFLPAVVPFSSVRKFGLTRRRWVPYPGLKEEIGLSTFEPDETFRSRLGVDDDAVVAVVRPAAEGAMYHRHPNSLCEQVVTHLAEEGVTVLVTPRTKSQGDMYRDTRGVRVLDKAVSGPDLLYHADIFIGAGGSMTREAALLGTPTFSIFQGKPAAVDQALEDDGRLVALKSVEDLPAPRRLRRTTAQAEKGRALAQFAELLMEQAVALAHR